MCNVGSAPLFLQRSWRDFLGSAPRLRPGSGAFLLICIKRDGRVALKSSHLTCCYAD
jgi:hypothetical protein